MITNGETMKSEMEDVKILVTDKKLSAIPDVKNFLELCIKSAVKQLVIIADTIEGDVLATIIMARMKGQINVLAIQAPGYGDEKIDNLQDIAFLTGAKFITDLGVMKMDDVTLADLGKASKVISSKDSTIIIGGEGDVKARVETLKVAKEEEKVDYKKEMISKRIAKLTGGVAVIKVGGATEAEIIEKKYRVEDALNATKSAVEEGIVVGGGLALLKACYGVNFDKFSTFRGKTIVDRAIEEPFKQICKNAGVDGAEVLFNVVSKNTGYNASNGEYCDMIESGIIDPTKVVRCSLENAASAAAMFLTTEVLITEKYDKKE
jgi:chaperonin GroEL